MSLPLDVWRETVPGTHKLYENGTVIARVRATENGAHVAEVGSCLLPGAFPSARVAYGAVWLFRRDPVRWLTGRAYWCRLVDVSRIEGLPLFSAEVQQAERHGVDCAGWKAT